MNATYADVAEETPEAYRLIQVLENQGRKIEWFAQQMGISRTYLYRFRLLPDNPLSRPVPPSFYERAERLLKVPYGTITGKPPRPPRARRPRGDGEVSTTDVHLIEERLAEAGRQASTAAV